LREAANAHAEVAAAHEATLQAQVEATQKIQRMKETMARQAEKEVTTLKKKLEVAERKAKDAANDIQVVVEGNLPRSPKV
jgi:dynactin complex subunit